MRRLVRLVLTGVVALGAQASAQNVTPSPTVVVDTALDRRTSEVASGLRCPVCQGLSIADSPSELAQEMKGLVREQLASGKTPDEVRQYFIDKYGEWVLLAPKPQGFNLLVYVLPMFLVVGGGWLVWRYVRAHSVASEPGSL